MMATAQCPDPELLSEYTSGDVSEETANSISVHLTTCVTCQHRVDDMARRGDSVIQRLRQPATVHSAGSSPTMDRMMADAAKLVVAPPAMQTATSTATKDTATKDPAAGAVGFGVFLHELRASGLLEPEEINRQLRAIATRDVEQFALEMVRRGKLTKYQAGLLARGMSRGLMLKNYEVLDKVGQGGMGLVFKARHRRMGRIVAIKVLPTAATKSPDSVRRFQREFQTAAKLIHENVVVAHDADESDGIHFMVMEFVEGGNLGQLVRQKGPLSIEHALDCILQAARGLQVAHDKGIVHRDIKPQNLLLDTQGTVKVLDLGLARLGLEGGASDELSQSDLTQSGTVMGTVDYMAPEQALNSKNADHRSDIYSLGCTLHFLLTGRSLYRGETLMEKLVAHREQPVPSLRQARSDVSEALDSVFQRMVAKQPADRYQSMAELRTDLKAIASGEAVPLVQLQHQPDPAEFEPTMEIFNAETIAEPLAPLSPLSEPTANWGTLPTAPAREPKPVWPQPTAVPRRHWFASLFDKIFSPRGVAILGVATAGVISIYLLAVFGVAFFERYAERSAARRQQQHRLANGGKGLALVVLPSVYYPPDYENLKKALDGHGIQFLTATPGGKEATWDGKSVTPDLALERADADDFDTVIFIGGKMEEFKRGGPANRAAKRLARGVSENQAPLVGLCLGRDVLFHTGAINKDEYAKAECGPYFNKTSRVITGPNEYAADQLVFRLEAAWKKESKYRSAR